MKHKTLKLSIICILNVILATIMPHITSAKAINLQNSVEYRANDYSSEIVMDVNTNRVLYSNNANAKKYMASTTKILTALCIIENCDLNENVKISKNTIGIEGSSIYLEEGEVLSVKDLLYGLMLRSGNDCAETLAVHCCGSVEKFAKLMNNRAREIGAKSSNFVNPHGLHDDNHYTTAYDLALISSEAIKNADFKDICSTKSVDIPFTTQNSKRHLVNKNKMLNKMDGCTGIKTGFTKKAGRCLVTSCERNGLELVSVVLNCGPMWERSTSILQNAFESYHSYNVVKKDEIIDFVKINGTNEEIPVTVKNDVILPLTNTEKSTLIFEIEYIEEIKKPLSKDTEIGLIKFYSKNNLIFSEKIYTILNVD